MAMIEMPGHESGAVPPLTPILCTIPQAAAFIARGTSFVYQAIALGQIKAVKSDKRTLVEVDSLRKYAADLPPAKIKPVVRRKKA
jgi:hypothetical protein